MTVLTEIYSFNSHSQTVSIEWRDQRSELCSFIVGDAQCVCGGGCMLAACPIDNSATSTTTTPPSWSPWDTSTYSISTSTTTSARRRKRQAPVTRTCHFCFCSPCEGKFRYVTQISQSSQHATCVLLKCVLQKIRMSLRSP